MRGYVRAAQDRGLSLPVGGSLSTVECLAAALAPNPPTGCQELSLRLLSTTLDMGPRSPTFPGVSGPWMRTSVQPSLVETCLPSSDLLLLPKLLANEETKRQRELTSQNLTHILTRHVPLPTQGFCSPRLLSHITKSTSTGSSCHPKMCSFSRLKNKN